MRTQWFRVDLAYGGLRSVGDPVYGRKGKGRDELQRQFLHAWRLAVNLPHAGPRIFTAPLAAEMHCENSDVLPAASVAVLVITA